MKQLKAARVEASRDDGGASWLWMASSMLDSARNEYVASSMKLVQGASRRFWFN